MWLWVAFIIMWVLLLICMYTLCKSAKNADAIIRRLFRHTPTSVATTLTEYIYKRYLKVYTAEEVFGQAGEELAELIQALNKLLRSVRGTTPTQYVTAYENLVEELVDVGIMTEVIIQAIEVSDDELNAVRIKKLARLQERCIRLATERGYDYGKEAVLSSATTKTKKR